MKILLTAINAKYIHSNLAVYSLRAYASKYKEHIELAEFTINHYTDDILQEIYKKKPHIIAFSCYIWNIRIVEDLMTELRKVLPDVKIWLGGPEISYDAEKRLANSDALTGMMIGEGEATFLELMEHYLDGTKELREISGICIRENGKVILTPQREAMDLSTIPFPYHDMKEFKNKIVYYESSRGCPFSCSYCLSSVDKRIRMRSFMLVKQELQFFLDRKVPQVKFVDRTFNCVREHTLSIWNFIREQDNGITNFHFEISADLLGEEELCLLNSLRPGLVQLEIGVQSTNPETLKGINRSMKLDKLKENVMRINRGRNIHQHLDLIAGLPFEGYERFRESFSDVYSMEPEQLQLGFLKVLKGTGMMEEQNSYGLHYKDCQPYEVMATKWISYDEILKLKKVEAMVEIYYNSRQFESYIQYAEHFFDNPFDFYQELGDFYEKHHLMTVKHARISRYEILLDYSLECLTPRGFHRQTAIELLLYDLYLRENLKSRPAFAPDNIQYKRQYYEFYSDEDNRAQYLPSYKDYDYKQISRLTHMEHFHVNLDLAMREGTISEKESFILFDYQDRNPLTYRSKVTVFDAAEGSWR